MRPSASELRPQAPFFTTWTSQLVNNIITFIQMFVFGRIQQIQLLGRDMRGSEHDQLWNQIEAEIHLHRHKTVIRACRGRKDPNNKTPAPPPPPPQAEATVGEEEDAESKARKRRGIGEPRTVVIQKVKTEGLGISITVRFSSCFLLILTTVWAYFVPIGPTEVRD